MRIMNPGCVESCGTMVNFWPQFRCERHHTCFSFFFFFNFSPIYILIFFFSTRAFTQCIMHLTWVLNCLDWAQLCWLNELFLCNLCTCFVPTMNWKNSLPGYELTATTSLCTFSCCTGSGRFRTFHILNVIMKFFSIIASIKIT